ncbi:MAG: DUF3299 domain-containing protein [Planctomycetota bacterium]
MPDSRSPTFEAPSGPSRTTIVVAAGALIGVGYMLGQFVFSSAEPQETLPPNVTQSKRVTASDAKPPASSDIDKATRAAAAERLALPPAATDVTADAIEGLLTDAIPEESVLPSDSGERVAHDPPSPGIVPVFGVKELGNFTYVDGDFSSVPSDVVALSGTSVTVTGYMLPIRQSDKIEEFLLVYDVAECCFGEPPGLEHLIWVVMPRDAPATFTFGQIAVTGTLRVEEVLSAGYVVSLIAIEDVTSVVEVR